MNKEKLINQIMKECEAEGEPVTREEAEEIAEMEIMAKNMRHYEKSEKPRKQATKERKVDVEKLAILSALAETLRSIGFDPSVEKEVAIHFGEYTLKLTRHRPQKK